MGLSPSPEASSEKPEAFSAGLPDVMPERPRVALLIETSNSYARGLLRGIDRYLREHRPWAIDMPEQGRGALPPAHLARWRGDGIIARIENAGIAAAVRQ